MLTKDFDYNLPQELIAQEPAASRELSRLLVLSRSDGSIKDKFFPDITKYLEPGDCIVINDTKVLPARFYAKRKTGANIEGLLLDSQGKKFNAMIKNARKIKPPETIIALNRQGREHCRIKIIQKKRGNCQLEVIGQQNAIEMLQQIGYAPLPPYIKRNAQDKRNLSDIERYQTVYAKNTGAVAAPTAGLHFTEKIIQQLRKQGINTANITLHVGAGTFKPVTTEHIEDHQMHSEKYCVTEKAAENINNAKKNNGKIIAVGTTAVRTLETVAEKNGLIQPASGNTKLFIKPGYKFKTVQAMVTNFHLPRSTLLALVSAMAGRENILRAYKHAIKKQYRFYSYGDAMLII
jgi:S-adenosylmethionine:tRNA ribosyltransferase-isomerase